MSNLTANISRHEMLCKCGKCTFDVADYELLIVAQDAADFFKHRYRADKVMMIITSGNRCKEHNEIVQLEFDPDYIPFSSNSYHIHGKAMDFKLKIFVNGQWEFIRAYELAQYLDSKYPHKYGVITYWAGRVHLDIRTTKYRASK